MHRRARNRLCLWLILLGLANFLCYAAGYAVVCGDARNGGRRPDGQFYVRGHHFRFPGGRETDVSRGVWIYSYLHSITIWPSIAAVLLAMMLLARPHLIATYRDGAFVGAAFWNILAVVILLLTLALTAFFVSDFIRLLLAV